MLANLTQPTAVRFAKDGRIFIAERSGIVKVFDPARGGAPSIFADLRTQVHNFWDRGLLDLALHPDFPATPYLYVLYTYDAALGGMAPRWGTPGATADGCPTPPGPTERGCVVSGRLSRLEVGDSGLRGLEKVLIENWPQQFPSHSIGSLQFGPDGMLYVSAGDGASFEFVDYGQVGDPPNPLGDPPLAAGGKQTPPSARGGALRAQNVAVSGFPARFNGKVLRVDPLSGAPAVDNPLSTGDAAAIVASGFRNPFRMTFRPGTNELWIGDVGWGAWEEIDRLIDPRGPTLENFGWPCFEGDERQSGYEAAGLSACSTLYSGNAHVPPFYAYFHPDEVVEGDGCGTDQAAISGLAFYADGLYPSEYRAALFFADYARNCIWVMPPGPDGLPSPQNRRVFAQGAPTPVQLLIGPGNDLYYTSIGDGALHRIAALGANQPPLAKIAVSRSDGAVPLSVTFAASGSSDPDPGDTLSYAWDLDGDGEYDDATGARAEFVYTTAGERTAGLRVTDSRGAVATAQQRIVAGVDGSGLRASIAPISPAQFKVGDSIAFSGQGFDGEQPLPAADLQWDLIIEHCPVADQCHPHLIQSFEGVESGTFVAPEHDYPYYLELILRVSAGDGRQATALVRLDPITVNLTLESDPPGVQLALNQSVEATPFTASVVVGSQNTLSAPDYPGYAFASWSDGGARAHLITASGAQIVRASYGISATPAQLKHAGTPIVRVAASIGGGSRSIDVMRDEEYPPPGTADSLKQYDTLSPEFGPKDDWFGYEFKNGLYAFSRVQFQEGRNFFDGGWFEGLRVRVRRDGAWRDVVAGSVTPAYPGTSDGVGFRSYRFDFANTIGDAIQVYGPAGGSAYFVSVGELDVYGWRAIQSPAALPLAQLAAAPALVLSGEEVGLDARASFDPNGEPIEYWWTQSAGPSVTLLDASSPQPHFSAPNVSQPTTLTFVLTVRAGTRSSAAVSSTFTITPLNGPVDLSSRGRISISEPVPRGGGSRNPEVIRDGIEPAPGSSDISQQWDTFAADPSVSQGWVGYAFDTSYRFGRLRFQEGFEFRDGGWFESLSVEIRRDGHWLPVQGLRSTPVYPGASDGVGFQVYDLQFTPAVGDAIRLSGPPGGANAFFSVAELRAFIVPAPSGDAAPSANAGADFNTSSGTTVALDASRSMDSEGATLTYNWQQVSGPTVTLSDANAASPTFQAPTVRTATELIFSLTVSDGTNASQPDRVSAIIDPPRSPLDVTSYGSILASVRFPAGGGSQDLEVIRDGVVPIPGDTSLEAEYNTFTGQITNSGFIGYQFTAQSELTFSQLNFQEGLHFVDGGWFTSLEVQIRRSGEWHSASDLTITPTYFGDGAGPGYETFTLRFRPAVGDAIRLIGPPGGAYTFFSVAELRAFAL